MDQKRIGILGGMGPEATIHFYHLIVKKTPSSVDQDHIQTLIYSNPKIPDRTHAILTGETQEIIEALQKSAQILEKGGSDFIVIPCNTAHFFIEEIRQGVSISVFDMIETAGEFISTDIVHESAHMQIGIMGTRGTISSGLYQRKFARYHLEVISPDEHLQELTMQIIYQIKNTGASEKLREQMIQYIEMFRHTHNFSWIVLGCTELPLLFHDQEDLTHFHLVDPMQILAEKVVKEVKKK